MNLSKFLNFNKKCPVCDNQLTLYMYCNDKSLWKAKSVDNLMYTFSQFGAQNSGYTEDDYITLYNNKSNFDIHFNSSKLENDSKTWNLYFFLLCNNDGLTNADYYFDINVYKGCYFRSSPFMDFKKNNSKWELEITNPDHISMVNRNEIFAFKTNDNLTNTEKVYVMQLDYELNKTNFNHYSVTEEQYNDNRFEPNIFEKEMELLPTRPNFDLSKRDQLISRFDSWVILS